MEKYIKLIKKNWSELKKLPKLYVEDIIKVDEPMRMYLYACYGYLEMLNNYDFAQLSITINENNDNLLLLAAYFLNIELIEYLENMGLNINYTNNNGLNTYLIAVMLENIEFMEYLKNKYINIYHKDKYNDNAYLYAIRIGNFKVIKYLEKNGFYYYQQNIVNNTDNNAVFFAVCYGHLKIVKHLEKKGVF